MIIGWQKLASLGLARTFTTFVPKDKCKPTFFPTTSRALLAFDPVTSDSNRQAATNIVSCNRLLNDLITSGRVSSALNLFAELPTRDVVTWNVMISGLYRRGFSRKSLYIYKQMVSRGIIESSSTLSSVLSICSNAGFYRAGLEVHCRVIILGLSMNIYIVSALIDLYMHIGVLDVALKLFNGIIEKNLAVWNLILRGFCEMGRSDELLRLYGEMILQGVVPNGLTFCYLIRVCGNEKVLEEGLKLHCKVIKIGWSESNLFVANALVDFYSACGEVVDAWKSFEVIPPSDVISWNSLVSVYLNNGFSSYALEMFNRMQFWGKKPSASSFLGFLYLSSTAKDLLFGKQIHCYAIKLGFENGNVLIQSSLIDVYGKCGEIENSVHIFENAVDRNIECCNSLMTSLLTCGFFEDVIEFFGLMIDENIGFDEVGLSSTLKALSVSASPHLAGCNLLHSVAIKSGFEHSIAVGCSLIDAYSRSGEIKSCSQVFGTLPSRNVISFTAIINAFARNGMGMEGIKMLNAMIQDGLKPDSVTFLCVLMGCNNSGLVKEGMLFFDSMEAFYGICPERKHYSCMVNLLARAGLVEVVEKLLTDGPAEDDYIMWSSLLRSCRIHGNEQVGRRAARKLMELKPKDPAAWLQVSQFYSEIGDFETAMHIREVAMAKRMSTEICTSLIQVYDGY